MRSSHQVFTESLAALERSTRATLDVMLRGLLKDDLRLHAHVHRVAHLSVSVGLLCGIREPELSAVEWAALLHHSGASERDHHDRPPASAAAVVTADAAIYDRGLNLLRSVPAFAGSARLVAALHEWQRNAAPQAVGQAVPCLSVRVIAMCDRFDTLTQPSADAVSHEAAVAILGREGKYDAVLIEALCELRAIRMPATQSPSIRSRRSRVLSHLPKSSRDWHDQHPGRTAATQNLPWVRANASAMPGSA